jgi:hypothetical protein
MEGQSGHQDALFPTRVGAVIAPGSHGVGMGLRKTFSLNRMRTAAAAAAMLVPVMALGQYPGQVSKKAKGAPDLRAIAVLEWTGEAGKPKACRMVPVMVYDGEKLQDAGIYLARPQPLALSGEVEYELKANGKTFGFFDIQNAGQEQGSWVGYGKWKPMPPPKTPEAISPGKVDDFQDEKPVLHRKQHGGEGSGSGPASGGSSSSSDSAAHDDPDRPKLEKKTDSGSTTNTPASSAPADDPDRPKLEKKPDNSKPASPDADRRTVQKTNPELAQNLGDVSSVSDSDPDRPKLKRGKSSGGGVDVAPTLMGLPPDMQQAVAVSDAKSRPDHPWTYSWANPDDADKMKAAVEDIARQALGLAAPEPAAAPAPRRAGTAARRTVKPAAPPPPPAALADEQFRVFELAYGSGATLVLTAHTDGPPPSLKFVTIVAQPDLYGKVRVLLKSVTDRAHLDETPRMRLVDAVDALADNRGELLFELRGEGSRQFALYRIYGGMAEKLFVTSSGVYGTMSSE